MSKLYPYFFVLLLHVHLPPPLQGHLHVVLLVQDGFDAVGPKQLSQELDTYMQLVRGVGCVDQVSCG